MRTILFLSGAEGSGTTMLARILSNAGQVMTISGKHHTITREADREAFKLLKRFNRMTKFLWDRRGTVENHLQAKKKMVEVIKDFAALERYQHITHFLLKRSAPFYKGDRYRPDAADVLDLFPDVRMIMTYRDPRASTFSALRRGFAGNLREAAVVCEEQLTYISAQLATLSTAQYRVIPYEAFCASPEKFTPDLAAFCGFSTEALLKAIEQEQIDNTRNDLWQQSLTPGEMEFLDQFFNPRRIVQWKLLAGK
jgi:hypothetical protein